MYPFKRNAIELKELKESDLDKVFGGETEGVNPDYIPELEDTERTIPTDPSRRKKKRLSGVE